MSQDEEGRVVRYLIFAGTNGSGKSHQMRKWLKANPRNLILPASRADKQWRGIAELQSKVVHRRDRFDAAGKKRIPMFVIPGVGGFQGNRVLHIEGTDKERSMMFDAVIHPQWGFDYGGIFIDDSKNFIKTKGSLPAKVRTFWGDRRLHQVDIFMAAWQYQDINADFYGFAPQLFIFRVEREPNRDVLAKFKRPDEFMATHRWVQAVNEWLPENYQWYFMPYPWIGNVRPGTDARAAAHAFAKANLPPGALLRMP